MARFAGGLLLSLVLLITWMPGTAQAWDFGKNGSCPVQDSSGDYVLTNRVTYNLTSTDHIWGKMYGKAFGGRDGHNNFRGSVWQGDWRKWIHDSADTYDAGEQWHKDIVNGEGVHIRTRRSYTEVVYTTAWFDVFGEDPSCTVGLTF